MAFGLNTEPQNEKEQKTKGQKRREKRREDRENRQAERAAREEARFEAEGFRSKGLRLDKFRYNFDQGARPNRYEVNFYCNNLGINLEGLRCTEATLPGRQLESVDWSAYGPTEKRPYQLSMDNQEVTFQFVCDVNFSDRYIIEAWLGAIFAGGDGSSSVLPEFSYYNDYIGEIHINTMAQNEEKALSYKLINAFPISYAPMSLGYDQTDSMLKFECTFAFKTYETTYHFTPTSSALNRGSRAIDALLGLTNLPVFGRKGNSANNTLQRFNDRLQKLSGIIGNNRTDTTPDIKPKSSSVNRTPFNPSLGSF